MKPLYFLPLVTLIFASSRPRGGTTRFSGGVQRLDPALDKLIAPDAKIEVLATGFNWSEGLLVFKTNWCSPMSLKIRLWVEGGSTTAGAW